MKTAADPRHRIRRQILQELFANEFASQDSSQAAKQIISYIKDIDDLILKAAPEWPIEKINKVDLAILHLSIWEILNKKAPIKVIIDEAVELAKEFGSENSASFVNGVLGTVCKNLNLN